MDTNFISAIIGGAIGFAGGAAKPLIDWEIEKKKLRRAERRSFIDALRKKLEGNSPNLQEFIHTDLYARLRPHLSPDLIKKLEIHSNVIEIVVDHNRYGDHVDLLEEIDELEHSWNL